MKSKVKSMNAMFSDEAIAIAKFAKGEFDVNVFPIIPNNTIMYLSVFRGVKFQVEHLNNVKSKSPSEIQLTNYLRVVEDKIRSGLTFDQDRTFHMSDAEAAEFQDAANKAYAKGNIGMLKLLQLYPFNTLDVSPLIVIYDKDCNWKDISDLMIEMGTDVYGLNYVRGDGSFSFDIPAPDKKAEFSLYLNQLCNLLSSKSHKVTWVSRDDDTTETEVAETE